MLARWYLLTVFSNIRILSRGHSMPTRTACRDNVVSVNDQTVRCRHKILPAPKNNEEIEMVDQPFAASEIGQSMDADLLPELSSETLVASALTE